MFHYFLVQQHYKSVPEMAVQLFRTTELENSVQQ
jgi:hypothetical protein